MKSRYSFMKESKIADTDGNSFPDPLSIAYNDVQYTQIPIQHTVSAGDISKFWLTMYNKYNMTEMDDVLLNLNGVPYIGMLEPGDSIYLIDINDVENFSTQKRLGSE